MSDQWQRASDVAPPRDRSFGAYAHSVPGRLCAARWSEERQEYLTAGEARVEPVWWLTIPPDPEGSSEPRDDGEPAVIATPWGLMAA